MTRKVISLRLDDHVGTAYQKMKTNQVRHLPILNDKNEVVGIFSATDLNLAYSPRETEAGWYYDKAELNTLNVKHHMTKDPSTLYPKHSLRDAAELIVRNKIGCIPIVDAKSKRLVGIISYVDILRQMTQLFES